MNFLRLAKTVQRLALLAIIFTTPTACSLAPSAAHCRTSQEFLQAIYNPNVSLLLVLRDLAFTEADWSQYTSPLLLQRDVTVSSTQDSYIWWPLIDLGFVASKVKLAANITLIFTRVVIRNWRKGPEFQAPGLDLFATNKEISTLDHNYNLPNLKFINVAFIQRSCLMPSLGQVAAETMRRPAFIPGNQIARTPLPQDGCVNSSTAPVMQRCWPLAMSFDDVVMYGYNLNEYNPEPTGYVLWLEQTPVRCEAVMDESCVEMYGTLGCFYKLYPASPLASSNGSVQGAAEGGGGGRSHSHGQTPLAAVLGGVLGGEGSCRRNGGGGGERVLKTRRLLRWGLPYRPSMALYQPGYAPSPRLRPHHQARKDPVLVPRRANRNR
ncbi:hypothetical protein Vafri_11938 [Volvox africanus]|uniref:Pherophorin domain-containing protein n=1 Tax=Volvox africanus TaxID=51714 RepID=A0A8J4B8Y6_9CHLO|nr:hypothetical protein Vafri_11938 [Volvox africanus]